SNRRPNLDRTTTLAWGFPIAWDHYSCYRSSAMAPPPYKAFATRSRPVPWCRRNRPSAPVGARLPLRNPIRLPLPSQESTPSWDRFFQAEARLPQVRPRLGLERTADGASLSNADGIRHTLYGGFSHCFQGRAK